MMISSLLSLCICRVWNLATKALSSPLPTAIVYVLAVLCIFDRAAVAGEQAWFDAELQ